MITKDEKEIIEKHIKVSYNNHIYGDCYIDSYLVIDIIKENKVFIVIIEYFADNLLIGKRKIEIKSHLIKAQIRENKINSVLNVSTYN